MRKVRKIMVMEFAVISDLLATVAKGDTLHQYVRLFCGRLVWLSSCIKVFSSMGVTDVVSIHLVRA